MMDTIEKLAEIAPRHYAFLVKTAEEIKDSPFKDDILSELDVLVKKAFNLPKMPNMSWAAPAAKAVGMSALGVAGAAGAGIAYALAGDMYDAAKRGLTKTRNYKNMLEANPDLKQLPAKNVQKAFSVLHRLNPEFSGDPTISGAWVKRQSTFGEDAFGDAAGLKSLIDSRKSLTDLRRLPAVPQTSKGRGLSQKDLEKQVGILQNDIGAYSGRINDRFDSWDAALKTQAPASKK